jgi:hypothetical protein
MTAPIPAGPPPLPPAAWQAESNILEGYKTGVLMDGRSDYCAIIGNIIIRAENVLLQSPVSVLNPIQILTLQNPPLLVNDGRSYGVDVTVPQAAVRDNRINLSNAAHGGVRASGKETLVESNAISSDRAPGAPTQPAPLGILVSPTDAGTPDGSLIRSNVLTGGQDAIVVLGSDLQRIRIDWNQVGPSPQAPPHRPRLAIALKSTHGAVIEGNQIRGAWRAVSLSGGSANRVLHNDLRDGELGVLAYDGIDETGLALSHNHIENMDGPGVIGARLVNTASISHNHIVRCGHFDLKSGDGAPMISPPRAGLFVEAHGHLRLESCEVIDAGVSAEGNTGTSAVIAMHIRALSCQITNNRTSYSDPVSAAFQQLHHRALLLLELPQTTRVDHANIAGNSLSGPGVPHLVEVDRVQPTTDGFEEIQFSDNHCRHITENVAPNLQGAVTVSLRGRHLIVMGNHVKAVAGMNSMIFHHPEKLALMGNFASGSMHEELPANVNDRVPQNITGFNFESVI